MTNVAIYLRISLYDGDVEETGKRESNSIENQRQLITDYLQKNAELSGRVTEYVDDGYTGTNFDRPGFRKMVEDAKKGRIQVIIAKDLSRLGRNFVELGDYLDQIFPRLGVRVIAICSGYDGGTAQGYAGGMDASITNFINASYVRDLSEKRKSGIAALLKSGIDPAARIPYGYRYVPGDRNKWHVDGEAAKIVKLIFEMAADGYRPMEIVDRLNALGTEIPGERKMRVYGINYSFLETERERLWDYNKVRQVIMNYEYTGAAVGHKTETSASENFKRHGIPKGEWTVIEGHHEAIVDGNAFERAQRILRRAPFRDAGRPAVLALKSKLRCDNCHLAFQYSKGDKTMRCKHRDDAGRYSGCGRKRYSYSRMETAVFARVREHAAKLASLAEESGKVLAAESAVLKEKKKTAEEEIRRLKAERVSQYERYAAGLTDRADFVREKEALTDKIERLEGESRSIEEALTADGDLRDELEAALEKSRHVLRSPVMTKTIADHFVRNAYVSDYDRMEVRFVTEDLIGRATARCGEINGKNQKRNAARKHSGVHKGG